MCTAHYDLYIVPPPQPVPPGDPPPGPNAASLDQQNMDGTVDPDRPDLRRPDDEGAEWDNEDFYQPDDDGGHGMPPDEDLPPPAGVDSQFYGPGDKLYQNYHSKLNGCPCDEQGEFLAPGTPPPLDIAGSDNWAPYGDQIAFETAEFLFT
ncbi:hypothetical protein HYDPIDRAFT_25141 [Hydnomerulius pinastri MD-312]|nr:hypothetical protein HYDPIDRAFT_25141 [Hydnomerulius pinastri MD-312]